MAEGLGFENVKDKISGPLAVHGPFIILANTYTPVPSSLPVTRSLSAEKLKVLVRYYRRCDTTIMTRLAELNVLQWFLAHFSTV